MDLKDVLIFFIEISCPNITDVGVEALLQRHCKSLKVLGLMGVPYNARADALDNGAPYDFPFLHDLTFGNVDVVISFLQRFALCPNLYRIQLDQLDNIDVKTLSELIESNKSGDNAGFPALKELVLSSEWTDSTPESAMESLELICFDNGIALMVEPPDSDDDEDEYSDDEEMLGDLSDSGQSFDANIRHDSTDDEDWGDGEYEDAADSDDYPVA